MTVCKNYNCVCTRSMMMILFDEVFPFCFHCKTSLFSQLISKKIFIISKALNCFLDRFQMEIANFSFNQYQRWCKSSLWLWSWFNKAINEIHKSLIKEDFINSSILRPAWHDGTYITNDLTRLDGTSLINKYKKAKEVEQVYFVENVKTNIITVNYHCHIDLGIWIVHGTFVSNNKLIVR